MRRFLSRSLFALGFCALVSSANAQITISTPSTGSVGYWGTPDSISTPTYGQSFTTPTGNPFLQSVTFNIRNTNADTPFRAYVYAWNGTVIDTTGSALYTSDILSVANASDFIPVTVSDINTYLTPGGTYAVFYSTLGFTGHMGSETFQGCPDSAYTGGTFIYNGARTFGALQGNWQDSQGANDLTFSMDFTPASTATPEPGTFALLGVSLLSGAGLLRRKRRAAKAA